MIGVGWRLGRRWRLLVVGVAVWAAVSPSPAWAEDRFSSDAFIVLDRTTVLDLMPMLAAQCPRGGPIAGSPSVPAFSTARSHAYALVSKGTAAKGLASIRRLAPTGRQAERLAAGLELNASPRGALAALLVDIERAPTDAAAFTAVATVLVQLGHPTDALAYAKRAGTLRGHAVMGLRSSALAQAATGYALVSMRRYAAATTVLTQALAAAPTLAEARTNLGDAALCRGRFAEAARAFRMAATRTPQSPQEPSPDSPTVGTIGAGDPTADTRRPAAAIVDLSKGVRWTLPNIRYAVSTVDDATILAKYGPWLADVDASMIAERLGPYAQTHAAWEAHLRVLADADSAELSYAIYLASGGVAQEPTVKPLVALESKAYADFNDQLQRLATAWTSARVAATACTDAACYYNICEPAASTLLDGWRIVAQGYDAAVRKRFSEESRIMTALAAATAEPLLHEDIRLQLRATAEVALHTLLTIALSGPNLVAPADSPPDQPCAFTTDPPVVDTGTIDGQAMPGTCNPSAPFGKVTFLSKLTVGASCDHVEASVSVDALPLGLLGAFGKVIATKSTGIVTVVVGARGGQLGLDWESGAYVKWDPATHTVKDFGWRTGPSIAPGHTVSVDMNVSQVDISFVGAIDYIPTAFGLR